MIEFSDEQRVRLTAEQRAARRKNNHNPTTVRYQAVELERTRLPEEDIHAIIGLAFIYRRQRDGAMAARAPVVAMERYYPGEQHMLPNPPKTHVHACTVPYRLRRYGVVEDDPEGSEIRVYRKISAVQADNWRIHQFGTPNTGRVKRMEDPIPEPGESVLLDYGTSDDAFRAMTAWRSSRAPRFGWLISLSREPGSSVVRVTRAI